MNVTDRQTETGDRRRNKSQ